MGKFWTVVLLISVSITYTTAAVQTVNGKIKIRIGGTAGSSAQQIFMTNFIPVYDVYKRFLEVEFVQWGRTRIDNGTLECEFGDNDCWANHLQRCSLHLLRGNQDAQVQYMGCEYTNPLPGFTLGTYLCAQTVGLSLIDVDYCMSTNGVQLEAEAQEISQEPMRIINYVPHILFNNVIDVNNHLQALRRLKSVICFALADDPSTGVTSCQI